MGHEGERGTDSDLGAAARTDRSGATDEIAAHLSVLRMSPAERDAGDVERSAVETALQAVIEEGSREQKVFESLELPRIEIDHESIRSDNVHPVVFRDCSIEALSVVSANVDVPIKFLECDIGPVDLTETHHQHDVAFRGSTVESITATETQFRQDADFSEVLFTDAVVMEETHFGDDTRFTDAEFRGPVSMRAAEFNGTSNELDDNATFSRATFRSRVEFDRASFEAASFEAVTFEENASFDNALATGELLFRSVECRGPVEFRGSRLDAAGIFEGARFDGGADFTGAELDRAVFDRARFSDGASFGTVTFSRHASFESAAFEAAAVFDESRFARGGAFTDATFGDVALFRGVHFEQATRHRSRDAVFERARFEAAADFRNARIASANFLDTVFVDDAVLRNAVVSTEFALAPASPSAGTYVDFTGAKLRRGEIELPEGGCWIDLTVASVGDLSFEASDTQTQRHLLDHVRFCDTEFDEFDSDSFDFSEYTGHFKRNGWKLHRFEIPEVRSYEKPMTAQNIERTYLKAKIGASNTGFVDAAAEFRLRRQRWARRTLLDAVRSGDTRPLIRLKNLSRVAENLFLDLTCGYGVRLGRILLVFLVAPFLPGLLYAFGGAHFATGAGQVSSLGAALTPAGRQIVYENLYFSYITFLTIGYGGVRPEAVLSQLLAGAEVYLNVVLGGLFIYSLVKRSEL